ncbi:MAG: radical SAM protein [bacterium]
MNILLIDPKRINLETYLIIPNIGLGYIATALRRAGHEPSICNAARDSILPEKAAETVAAGGFRLVGVNVFTPYFSSAAAYARAVKKKNPAVTLVAGGPHAIFEPEETLTLIPEFDYAVTGEGEETLPALASLLEKSEVPAPDSLSAIPNLAFRSGGNVVLTPRKLIEDIRPLDMAAWDLIGPHLFSLFPNGIFTMKKKIAPIITSRGCPYPCSFCGAGRAMGKRVRRRDPDSVIEEIELLRNKYDIREIHIMDDNFISDRAAAVQICENLIRKKLDIVWACPTGIRLDGLDAELVSLMSRAGCYSTAVGIESGSQRVLNMMNKKLKLDDAPEKVNLLRRNGIRVTGFFILGFPDENAQDMRETIQLALRLNINRANFFNFTPFPGSDMYDKLKAAGRLNNLDYDETYIHNLSYCHETISQAELIKAQRGAHFRFYLRPRIFLNLLREIHSYSQVRIIFQRAMKIIFPGKPKK